MENTPYFNKKREKDENPSYFDNKFSSFTCIINKNELMESNQPPKKKIYTQEEIMAMTNFEEKY